MKKSVSGPKASITTLKFGRYGLVGWLFASFTLMRMFVVGGDGDRGGLLVAALKPAIPAQIYIAIARLVTLIPV